MRLRAPAHRGMRAAEAAFGHVQGPIGAERQPARIVQAGREDRDHRVVPLTLGLRMADARLGARRDIASRYPEETDERDHEWCS